VTSHGRRLQIFGSCMLSASGGWARLERPSRADVERPDRPKPNVFADRSALALTSV